MTPDEPNSRSRRRSSPASQDYAVSPPTVSLAELIELERGELMQIHAMVRCLNDVLLYSDDDDSPMHADVAQVVARLLDESIIRLEVVRARVAQLEQAAAQTEKEMDPSPPYQVKESRAVYLC